MDFLSEFWTYLKERKKCFLLPFFIVAIVFGGLVGSDKGIGGCTVHLHAVLTRWLF